MKINKEHIKFLIKKRTLKQKQVAEQLNVTQQDFNNWMFRGIFPHFNKLEELAVILETDVSNLYSLENVADPAERYNSNQSNKNEDMIPLFEIEGQYGLAALWMNASFDQPKDYLHIPGVKADLFISYFGQGMEPQLSNGDLIGLRKIVDQSFYNYGATHAIVTQEQLLIKALLKSTQKDTLLLTNLEDEENTIEIPSKSIRALYSVVVVIKRNLL